MWLITIGCWLHVILDNYAIQRCVDGIRGEILMIVAAVPVVWLWALIAGGVT